MIIGLFIKALEMPFLCEEDLEYDEDQEVEMMEVHKEVSGGNVH